MCSCLGASDDFIKIVKSEIVNFVWNGKKPEIKYHTLIGNYEQGGLKFLDFDCIIKASLFKWAKRLMDDNVIYWKAFPLIKLQKIGGIECVRENFNYKKIT